LNYSNAGKENLHTLIAVKLMKFTDKPSKFRAYFKNCVDTTASVLFGEFISFLQMGNLKKIDKLPSRFYIKKGIFPLL
jgi:hypothetical protein